MKLVIDANVFVSGLFWRGVPGVVTDRVLVYKRDALLISRAIMSEFELVFNKRKFADKKPISEPAFKLIKKFGIMVPIPPDLSVADSGCRDPKDVMYLECAVAGNADYLISGDADLHMLKNYRGITIASPREYLDIVG